MRHTGKTKKGFATMDPKKQREIASKGGKAAHAKGAAHEFDSAEATLAGGKGGRSIVAKRGREYMAEIGKRGGAARSAQRVEQPSA